ncbi:hypothetical protein Pst134EB_013994 [Puccinia striiformis f. sp. tritici]|uniref:Post-GPI attachment to proteins factor 3 n=1 Tax=Puccinia striiformis TaxID=27350 RepID=A0A2S4VWG3_9BASI|nr:hypothetical protein Pst134EB_013994 [Puccinia striiformis f. sp. tritici]POW13853.1 hypothetical protein PSTT_03412 [Puccinia striiformis]
MKAITKIRSSSSSPSTIWVFILTFPVINIRSSPGDYSPGYQRCVNYCNFENCYTVDQDPPPLPLTLRLFQWTCTDNCAYQCMHDLTQKVLKLPRAVPQPGQTFEGWWDEPDWEPGTELEGLPPGRIVQFHGKWPFKRWYGVQEPLSALFSLLNFLAYAFSYRKMNQLIPVDWPLRSHYLGVAIVGMNAWTWSILFHCRDRPWTERLDYFSAAAYSLYGLYVSSVRIFRLYPTQARHYIPLSQRLYLGSQLKLILSAMFLVHIAFLSFGERFNYKYNMAVNVIVGVLTILLWLSWTASHSRRPTKEHAKLNEDPVPPSPQSEQSDSPPPSPTPSQGGFFSSGWISILYESIPAITETGIEPPYVSKPIIPLVSLIGAGSLELLDFPPIWNMSLDAHALWHLATIPLGWIWCVGFLAQDAQWESRFVEGIDPPPLDSNQTKTDQKAPSSKLTPIDTTNTD